MRYTLLVLVGLSACVDYEIKDNKPNDDVTDEGAPEIRIEPPAIDFGSVDVGSTDLTIETITIYNDGDAALELYDMYLSDASAPFDFTSAGMVLLSPGGSTTFTAWFEPMDAAPASATVVVENNDPDEANAGVDLTAQGIAPMIELSPTADDFGTPYIGCDSVRPLVIKNIGNADLVVTDLSHLSASAELSYDARESVNGPLPWTIAPNDTVTVDMLYAPIDAEEDSGFITVASNDPSRPEATASQKADAVEAGENTDVFEQPIRSSVDLLWVVDNSGSMSEEQASLAENAENFINTMVAADADYHIAVITTDSGDFRDEFIDSEDTTGAIDSFVRQATPGTGGGSNEAGSEMAARCFDGGDCVDTDFFREDARLQILYVTDETDSSKMFSGWEWDAYVEYFQDLKSNPDDVTINAIAGDYPSGCATAYAGVGYYEQTLATDGLYLSICATDWADYLTTIGEEAAEQKNSFALTERPVEETIVVVVDGITYYSGWSYDDVNQTVDFETDSIPAGGSTITITYSTYGDCSV